MKNSNIDNVILEASSHGLKQKRLDFLNTAARNNAYLSPTNIAQARGMTGPSNFVQQVGGNINTLSTPINSTVASTTNAYQRYLDNPIIQQKSKYLFTA